MVQRTTDIAVCSFCSRPIGSEHVKCAECGGVYHTACWSANEGCTTFGCASVAAEDAEVSAQIPQAEIKNLRNQAASFAEPAPIAGKPGDETRITPLAKKPKAEPQPKRKSPPLSALTQHAQAVWETETLEVPPRQASEEEPDKGAKILAALAYVFGWVSGLIVYFSARKKPFVRFHALQSILLNLVYAALQIGLQIFRGIASLSSGTGGDIRPLIFAIITLVLSATYLIVWVLLVVRAFQGRRWKLPVLGDIAEKRVS